MTKARDLANLIAAGNPLADGAISVAEISDLTASAVELNKMDGLTASTAELNNVVGTTSALQTQLDNISVTSGSLTKSFASGETASITLAQAISPAPVVSATKEVSQVGQSSKGAWDVNATASNYDLHNTAYDTTLTPTTTGYGLSNASDESKTYSYGGTDNYMQKIAFSTDGTKFYLTGNTNKYVYQYNLTTAWDISTASAGSTFDVSTDLVESISSIAFKTDGSKMYVGAYINDRFVEYDLSTAWDVSTASSPAIFSDSSNLDRAIGMWFKPDGTRFYVTDFGSLHVKRFDLSTAWDITTSSYNSQYSLGSGSWRQLQFKSDGTAMYLLNDDASEDIREYTLSTAWDITTASLSGVEFEYLSEVGDNVPGFYIRTDNGATLYVMDNSPTPSRLRQYNISSQALTLGTGSFASTDVGKRIQGNGGDVTLTSTAGAYSTTGGSAFTDSSTIASGSWTMRGLKSAGDADGIGLAGIAVAGTLGTVDVFSDSSAISLHTLDNTLNDVGGTYTATSDSANYSSTEKQYGTHSFSTAAGRDFIIPYNQPNNGTWTVSFWYRKANNSGLADNNRMVDFKENVSSKGTTISWESDGQFHFILRASEGGYGAIPLGNVTDGNWHHIVCGSDSGTGQRPFLFVDGTEITASSGQNRSDSHEGTGIMFGSGFGGDVVYSQYDQVRIFNKNLSAAEVATLYAESTDSITIPTSQYHIGVTNSGGQIDTGFWNDINSMTADQTAGDGTVHYAVSTDDRTTWSVAKASDGVRPIVRDNSGTWQYNSNATYGSTTWTNATTNDEFYALQQALGAQAFNRMDKTQLDAVADGSHFTLGDTLDLAIALRMDTASVSTPKSDGVSINYDAQALNQGAVLGTDYDYDFPNSTTVRITSNAAQNLKVRVV